MSDAFQHCEQAVRETDKDRFLATLFAPADRRSDLFALYAFRGELARVRDVAREPLPGEIRLQWWRETLGGERSDEASGNPIAAALLAAAARRDLPTQRLIDMIEAHRFDLYDDPMNSTADLEAYAANTAGAVFELAGRIVGGTGVPALDRHAGIAYAVAGLLKAFPRHAARRQLYIPLEILQRHDVRAEDIFAGQATIATRTALGEMRSLARRHLDAAESALAAAPGASLPAYLPLALVRPLLARMERGDYDPFSPPEIPQWRRQWVLWRAARRPRIIAA